MHIAQLLLLKTISTKFFMMSSPQTDTIPRSVLAQSFVYPGSLFSAIDFILVVAAYTRQCRDTCHHSIRHYGAWKPQQSQHGRWCLLAFCQKLFASFETRRAADKSYICCFYSACNVLFTQKLKKFDIAMNPPTPELYFEVV